MDQTISAKDVETFDAGVLATITTGHFFTRDLDELGRAISWLAGRRVYLHELPEALELFGPCLARSCPALPKPGTVTADAVASIGAKLRRDYPNGFAVLRLSAPLAPGTLATLVAAKVIPVIAVIPNLTRGDFIHDRPSRH